MTIESKSGKPAALTKVRMALNRDVLVAEAAELAASPELDPCETTVPLRKADVPLDCLEESTGVCMSGNNGGLGSGGCISFSRSTSSIPVAKVVCFGLCIPCWF